MVEYTEKEIKNIKRAWLFFGALFMFVLVFSIAKWGHVFC